MKILYMSDKVVTALFDMKEQIPDGIKTVEPVQFSMRTDADPTEFSIPKIKLYEKVRSYFGAERGTVEVLFIHRGV